MIGLFDSGSGGLSVLQALRREAPNADIVYFGDIKNAPYGQKTPAELAALARQGIAFLKTMRAGEIIAACNSVSPSILAGAAEGTPVMEMTGPTARALLSYHGERMLLLATPATIASGIYTESLKGIALDSLPIPDLAAAIEFGESAEQIRLLIAAAFNKAPQTNYDALILGCTHYPLVRDLIEEEVSVFGTVTIIDPGEFVAKEAAQKFRVEGTGKLHFYISTESEFFRRRVAMLFPTVSKYIDVV